MKNWWIIVCFLTFSAFAQQADLELVVSSQSVSVGEKISITVKSNVSGNIKIDFPPEFNEGYSVVNGMKQEMDYTSGRFVSLYYLSKDGSFTKTGTFTIGPASINRGGKLIKSNTVSVKVEKGTGNNSSTRNQNPQQNTPSVSNRNKQPAYGLIGLSKNKVYEGEPLIARSYVYARFRPTHLDSYKTFEMNDVMDAHSLSQGNQINLEEKNVGGERLFVFSMDPKLVFPVKTGEHTIEPFQLELMCGFRNFPFTSNAPTYEVIPLPRNSPRSFEGGVGEFSITRKINAKEYKQGDVVQMQVEVSGVGNIHLLQEPDIALPDNIQIYGDPIVKEDYKFNTKGAEGKITYTYNIQLLDSGKVDVPEIKYAYFDLKSESYKVLKSNSIHLNIKGDPNFELITDLYKTDSTLVELEDDLLDEPFVQKKSQNTVLSNVNYFLTGSLLLVILVLLYFLFKNKRKEKSEEQIPKEDRGLNEELDILTFVDISSALKEIDELYSSGEGEPFYDMIHGTLITFLKNKLELNHNERHTPNSIIDKLEVENLEVEFITSVKQLLSTCETVRYGMPLSTLEREELYNKFKNIVS